MITLDELQDNTKWYLPEYEDPKRGTMRSRIIVLRVEEGSCYLNTPDGQHPSSKVSKHEALNALNEWKAELRT